MRFLSFVVMLTVSVLPVVAADEAPSNILTPKEIAGGWLLLFDGETTFGWNIDGECAADKGTLVLGGKKKTVVSPTTDFGQYWFQFQYRVEELNNAGIEIKVRDKSHKIRKSPQDSWQWMTVAAKSESVAFESEPPSKSSPRAGPISVTVDAGCRLAIRNIMIKPYGLNSIFNGKDLAGWKEFPGKKSKFGVTKEGWLNVKNGPGDLQTEKQYDDFILQLECISNGKFLNSGIFFRCLADQYQNGYEAQIQNGYRGDDRTKPIDFGTGAIYRRVPARKVVANDHEWFTMTVAARGKHIATWVNGYQTVDWTDSRPPDDNPRKGSKTGKGHISIQGHDPTTDLSFRNLRIVELPRGEGK